MIKSSLPLPLSLLNHTSYAWIPNINLPSPYPDSIDPQQFPLVGNDSGKSPYVPANPNQKSQTLPPRTLQSITFPSRDLITISRSLYDATSNIMDSIYSCVYPQSPALKYSSSTVFPNPCRYSVSYRDNLLGYKPSWLHSDS